VVIWRDHSYDKKDINQKRREGREKKVPGKPWGWRTALRLKDKELSAFLSFYIG